MNNEAIFVDGMIFKRPSANAPDYIKGKLSVKVEDFAKFMKQHEKLGWINIDLKESRAGKYYAQLDTWEAEPQDGYVEEEKRMTKKQ